MYVGSKCELLKHMNGAKLDLWDWHMLLTRALLLSSSRNGCGRFDCSLYSARKKLPEK